ncbi:MAG: hypothetical protein AMXMBFR33_44050 [Candidatus Xenobia bacterium]
MPSPRERASYLFQCRKYDSAIEACLEGLAAEPGEVSFYGIKASCELKLGRYAQAEVTARDGLSLRPDDPGCLGNLAVVLSLTGYPEAEHHACRLLELTTGNAVSWAVAAQVALNQGKHQLARERARKSLELQSSLPEARILEALARARAGTASKEFLLSLLAEQPESALALAILGEHELVAGRAQEAEECFKAALAEEPEDKGYQRMLLAARRCQLPVLGRLSLALARLAHAVDRQPLTAALGIGVLLTVNVAAFPHSLALPTLFIGLWMVRPVGNLLVRAGPRLDSEAPLVVLVALGSLLLLAFDWQERYVLGFFASIVPLSLSFVARPRTRGFFAFLFAATAVLALLQIPTAVLPLFVVSTLVAMFTCTSMAQV